jgi:hypothetical protein
MSVLEPAVQRAGTTPVIHEQRDGTGPVPVAPVEPPRAVADHVRSHSMGCYWDFVECRWQCRQP